MKRRVFFAIDLPQKAKNSFAQFFKDVIEISEVKWERPEKLHLTLIFLGFVDERKIQTLTTLLQSSNRVEQQFTLTIKPDLSTFPTLANPRVLWLPIEGNVDQLKNIATKLAKALKSEGFVFDKRFSPHLTLGRFRNWVKKEDKETIVKTVADKLPMQPVSFTVKTITLFESRLTAKGSEYKILAHYENSWH